MDEQRLREGEVGFAILRLNKGSVLATEALLHPFGFVEAEQFVVVIDEQVEVSQEILP